MHTDTNKELYVNGDIEATATLEVGGAHDAFVESTLDATGNTEDDRTLSAGGSHADTDKELYVNGDAEVTRHSGGGTDAFVGGDTVMTGKLAVGGPVSGGNDQEAVRPRATSSPPPLLWWEPTRLSEATPC